VRQLAGMGMTQNRAWGWAIDQRRHGEGQSASELRVTVGQERGRDRKERGTHHMETWNKDDSTSNRCSEMFISCARDLMNLPGSLGMSLSWLVARIVS
jgi:hypothetical protein